MPGRDAYRMWLEAGRPERGRYGVTVRDGVQWAWLDTAEGDRRWPLS